MRRGLDEGGADPLPPQLRLNEQTVELTFDYSSKPRDLVTAFGNQDLAALNLLGWKVDCVGMSP